MRRKRSKSHPASDQPRASIRPGGDPYRDDAKLPDPTSCPRCSAIFRDGRWQWGAPPADAHRTLCPACRRIEDGYPAGLVTLEGDFVQSHRDEICGLARNLEEREKSEHALKRIMHLRDLPEGGIEIATTDGHLAHAIGEALRSAYEGELETRYEERGVLTRVHWSRAG